MDSAKRRPIIFCLVGPAGSGKTSLAKKLLETYSSNLKKLVSATTRAPRPGEVNGVNYKFLSRVQFETAVANAEFFEWEEIHGNLYGQLKSSIEEAVRGKSDIILDIDIRGASSINQEFPEESVVIFLLPPTKAELKKRMQARAPIAEDELNRRMLTAEKELDSFQQAYEKRELVDYFLVNSVFEDTLQGLSRIIESERVRLVRQTPEGIKSLLQ